MKASRNVPPSRRSKKLTADLLAMSDVAHEAARRAMAGLASCDADALDGILTRDEPVNQAYVDVDLRCFTLLAPHYPLAADLGATLAAVKITGDLERVGDLAANIAEDVIRMVSARHVRHGAAALPGQE